MIYQMKKRENGSKKNVFSRGLDDIAGTIGIHAGSFEGIANAVKYRDSGRVIKNNIPLLKYGDYICSLIGGIFSLYNGDLTYKQANKALSAIPVVGNLPYTKEAKKRLAEGVSGERRAKR